MGSIPKPEAIKPYDPYNNRDLGARDFQQGSTHNKVPHRLGLIESNKISCVSSGCHEFVQISHRSRTLPSGRRNPSHGQIRNRTQNSLGQPPRSAGLLGQLGSLLVVHPLAFVAFLVVGCPFMAAGILLYLFSLPT